MPASPAIQRLSPVFLVALLAIGPALGLGIARFAYALILPAMKTDLAWTYVTSGVINTINAFGYLSGALLSGWMSRRFSPRLIFSTGIVLTIVSILGIGLSRDIIIIGLFRLIAGYAAAMAFISGGAMAAALAMAYSGRSGFLIGLFYGGTGFGIALSGLVVPPMMAWYGSHLWPQYWIALAVIATIFGIPALLGVGRVPVPEKRISGTPDTRLELAPMAMIMIAYVCFGAGSIAYMTFMFTFLSQSGMGPWGLACYWVLIGVAVMASPWLWGRLMTQMKGGAAFATLTAINAIGCLLPLLSAHFFVTLLSAAIFGCTFLAVVASTTAFVHRNTGAEDYPRAIALFAAAFGLGQTIGPLLSGAITDLSGSLAVGLIAGFGLVTLASLISLRQRDIRQSAI